MMYIVQPCCEWFHTVIYRSSQPAAFSVTQIRSKRYVQRRWGV